MLAHGLKLATRRPSSCRHSVLWRYRCATNRNRRSVSCARCVPVPGRAPGQAATPRVRRLACGQSAQPLAAARPLACGRSRPVRWSGCQTSRTPCCHLRRTSNSLAHRRSYAPPSNPLTRGLGAESALFAGRRCCAGCSRRNGHRMRCHSSGRAACSACSKEGRSVNETRQCENAFCSLLVLPWRRVFAPSLPVGEACVGSTAGEGSLGHSRGAVSLVGTAWPGARILGTFSQASNRYLSIGGGAIEPSASRSDHRCGDE